MAVKLVRSPRAHQDITEILRYTGDRCGKAKAREYRELIRAALKAITKNPDCGKIRGHYPGIRSYHIRQPGHDARHIVFYRLQGTAIVEVVRVLHDSMDFDRHLG